MKRCLSLSTLLEPQLLDYIVCSSVQQNRIQVTYVVLKFLVATVKEVRRNK